MNVITVTGLQLQFDQSISGIREDVFAQLIVDMINKKMDMEPLDYGIKLSITQETKTTVIKPVITPEN